MRKAIILCLALYGLSFAGILLPDKKFSDTENRILAQKPALNAEDIFSGKFGHDYEAYIADQFPLRDEWVALKTTAERLMLRREIKGIYLADDDYLIERHSGIFTTPTAKKNAKILAEFVRLHREENISVLIVPNAVTILRDKLPPFAPDDEAESYIDALRESLPADVWTDTVSVLKAHAGEYIYYRTDHHWTALGAFYVWREWSGSPNSADDYAVRTVTREFLGTVQSKLGIGTSPDTIEIFCPEYESLYDYEALKGKDKYAVFLGGNTGLRRIGGNAHNGRKILVIKDSYANCFIPFMMNDFEVIDVLDLRYSRSRVSRLLSQNNYNDIMILYNVSGFAEDTSIERLLR